MSVADTQGDIVQGGMVLGVGGVYGIKGVQSHGGWGMVPGGYGPLPPPHGQTDTCENITFPQLRLRPAEIKSTMENKQTLLF